MEARCEGKSLPVEARREAAPAPAPAPLPPRSLRTSVRRAIAATRQCLLDRQAADGSWCAELEGDTILESETILLLAFLGREDSPLARRAAAYLVEKQLPTGGWAMFPGGPLEISGSVKAYFALKLTGHDPAAEYMDRARAAILAHGGADAVNSFTRFFLAFLGQISYDQCPAVPPEMVLLPQWFPVNLYAMSAWSRTIVVPLSIVSALEPVRKLPPRLGIRELFLREPKDWPRLRCPGLPGKTGPLSLDGFFRAVNGVLKWAQRKGYTPLRRRAIAAARDWMLDRFPASDGLGAIYPPIVFSLVALRCLGYDDEHPAVQYCRKQLDDLVIENEETGTIRLQPCKSPVWDTALTLRALAAGGTRCDRPAVRRGVQWLLERQTTRQGDWAKTVRAEPGGWYFEAANEFYPDVDDTAMALMALWAQLQEPTMPASGLPPELGLVTRHGLAATSSGREPPCDEDQSETFHAARWSCDPHDWKRSAAAIDRGLRWMLSMQNDDGGWGAFDRNNNHRFLCYVPFADHNAMIDPSTPDLTGRVLEALGKGGRRLGDPAVDRGVAFLRKSQEADGSWFGRWGVNYIYGTWQAITGLIEVGLPTSDPAVMAAVNWLLSHQQAGGAWGESAASYDHPELRGQGPATASQTAWAVLGLVAAGLERHPAVIRGLRYLLRTQQPDGGWQETEFTGTGFPRVFYLRYHYYPIYFPLLALAQWAVSAQRRGVSSPDHTPGTQGVPGPDFCRPLHGARVGKNGTVPFDR
jgi:squalene-hopene/tetraprenyl-beta-curcumene cyclase